MINAMFVWRDLKLCRLTAHSQTVSQFFRNSTRLQTQHLGYGQREWRVKEYRFSENEYISPFSRLSTR